MVWDNKTEVYGAVMTVRILVGVLCVIMAVVVTFITLAILISRFRIK